MNAPCNYDVVKNQCVSIENAPANVSKDWQADIGYVSDDYFRLAYFIKP
jgi:hypothetical protein